MGSRQKVESRGWLYSINNNRRLVASPQSYYVMHCLCQLKMQVTSNEENAMQEHLLLHCQNGMPSHAMVMQKQKCYQTQLEGMHCCAMLTLVKVVLSQDVSQQS